MLPRYMLGLTIFIFFLTLYLRQPQAATYGGVSEALMSPSRQTKRKWGQHLVLGRASAP